MQKQGRVVITGLSCITCLGDGYEQVWDALLIGKSAESRVEGLPFSSEYRYACQIKYEVRHDSKNTYDRAETLAILGVKQALQDAGVFKSRNTMLAIIGTTMAGFYSIDKGQPPGKCSDIGDAVQTELNLKSCFTVPTACAAGNYAIAMAARLIKRGITDRVVCGGADAFSPIAFAGFSRLRAMARKKCRPFDEDREGLLVSEGAAFLVLESEKSASARNARIRAVISGYGISCDGYHITAPHPKGLGAYLAMRKATETAGIAPGDIDYICAHGTGTHANDSMEGEAISKLLGRRTSHIPVSSIKSSMGHAMGAASAIEAVACVMAVQTNTIPPTANCENVDPKLKIKVVKKAALKTTVNHALNNAFAFGGNNAVIVVSKWQK